VEEAGLVSVGSSTAKVKKHTIFFSSPFNAIPIVVATTCQDPGISGGLIDDTFAVSVTSVSTTRFFVNIVRVDDGPGWGQNLFLAYSAMTP